MSRRSTRAARSISLAVALLAGAAWAEGDSVVFYGVADVSGGGAAGAGKLSASWSPLIGLFNDRLRLGLGARLGAYFLRGGLLFGPAEDRFPVPQLQVISLNSFVQARVRIIRELEVGANIDVFGYGFGSTVVASESGSPFSRDHGARVSHLNLLELGSGDRGQLDSEFFAAYRFGSFGLRAGFTHFSLELTTRTPLDSGRDRFRHALNGGFVAVSYWH